MRVPHSDEMVTSYCNLTKLYFGESHETLMLVLLKTFTWRFRTGSGFTESIVHKESLLPECY